MTHSLTDRRHERLAAEDDLIDNIKAAIIAGKLTRVKKNACSCKSACAQALRAELQTSGSQEYTRVIVERRFSGQNAMFAMEAVVNLPLNRLPSARSPCDVMTTM